MPALVAILLAAVVGFANALCVCAIGSTARPESGDAAVSQVLACHASAPRDFDGGCCADNDDDDDGGAPAHGHHGSCGHCTDVDAATATYAKVVVPSPVPGPPLTIAFVPDVLHREDQLARPWFDHTGLSPPVLSTTLLSLFCSLNN